MVPRDDVPEMLARPRGQETRDATTSNVHYCHKHTEQCPKPAEFLSSSFNNKKHFQNIFPVVSGMRYIPSYSKQINTPNEKINIPQGPLLRAVGSCQRKQAKCW